MPPFELSVELLPNIRLESRDRWIYSADGQALDRWSRRHLGDSAAVGKDLEVVLHVARPGSYQVSWIYRSERSIGSVSGAAGSPARLEIGEAGLLEGVEVAPDSEQVQDLLRRLR